MRSYRRRREIKCGYAECEVRRAESGGGVLGSEPPPHQLENLGKRCKLPRRSPGPFKFGALWYLKIAPKQRNGIECANGTL